ncbi:MAG: hypothetical protein GX072_02550 [Lysinibacillus sp.]|nr:hypothetical protein [Lysinibacillus sp.]
MAEGVNIRADRVRIRAEGEHIRADRDGIRADGVYIRANKECIRADNPPLVKSSIKMTVSLKHRHNYPYTRNLIT